MFYVFLHLGPPHYIIMVKGLSYIVLHNAVLGMLTSTATVSACTRLAMTADMELKCRGGGGGGGGAGVLRATTSD